MARDASAGVIGLGSWDIPPPPRTSCTARSRRVASRSRARRRGTRGAPASVCSEVVVLYYAYCRRGLLVMFVVAAGAACSQLAPTVDDGPPREKEESKVVATRGAKSTAA